MNRIIIIIIIIIMMVTLAMRIHVGSLLKMIGDNYYKIFFSNIILSNPSGGG